MAVLYFRGNKESIVWHQLDLECLEASEEYGGLKNVRGVRISTVLCQDGKCGRKVRVSRRNCARKTASRTTLNSTVVVSNAVANTTLYLCAKYSLHGIEGSGKHVMKYTNGTREQAQQKGTLKEYRNG